jgi:hypothetical protein
MEGVTDLDPAIVEVLPTPFESEAADLQILNAPRNFGNSHTHECMGALR